MAYKNSVTVYIDGICRASNTVMPLKFGNYLDERLDECYLSLRAIKKDDFSPLTPVEIIIKQEEYFGTGDDKTTVSEKEYVEYYIVANDNATEMLIGKGVYNHELYLIEVTKIAECYVVDTLTYTNDLGRTYSANGGYAVPQWE